MFNISNELSRFVSGVNVESISKQDGDEFGGLNDNITQQKTVLFIVELCKDFLK